MQTKSLQKAFYTLFFLTLTILILTHSQESLYFALNSLNLWFTKMIPSLLPFMILSGIMVRLRLTESFASLLHPAFNTLFHVRKNVTYAIIMGFLCGFPMGARVTCDLLERNMITQKEGEFLLSFCNNIGPVYFLSFVVPLLHRKLLWPYLFGMYGLPLLYGLFLRYTRYRDCGFAEASGRRKRGIHGGELRLASQSGALSLLEQIDDAVYAGIQSILMLGGYMILFNLMNLFPFALKQCAGQINLPFPFAATRPGVLLSQILEGCKTLPSLIAPILEITGGLGMLGDSLPLLALLLLPFGGLSCIAQTYSMIKRSELSISQYVLHKLILTGLTGAYYLAWAFLFPNSFLR